MNHKKLSEMNRLQRMIVSVRLRRDELGADIDNLTRAGESVSRELGRDDALGEFIQWLEEIEPHMIDRETAMIEIRLLLSNLGK